MSDDKLSATAPQMFTARQVAERLSLSTETVRRLIREGHLRATKVSPRRLAISEEAIAEMLATMEALRREQERLRARKAELKREGMW